MWRILLRPLLFRLDPERAHHLAMRLFLVALALPGARWLLRRLSRVDDPRLATRVFGLDFPTPIGLAAGFDKDARWFRELGLLGFGFVEVGTVTARAQPGNPKPRLFRLPADRALLNRFGFNNEGAAAAATRIGAAPRSVRLGVNLGKSKVVANEEAIADYLESFERLAPLADYVVVNVSSPNTAGLRELQEKEALRGLLSALLARRETLRPGVPVLVKIAPDLTEKQLEDVIALAVELGLDGLVATNTTLSREGLRTPPAQVEALGAGGLSGAPLTLRSRAFVARAFRLSKGRLPIIGVGGVMTGEDAWELLRAGASLVQTYTGFIYGGPGFVRDVQKELLRRLEAAGRRSIGEVVGEASGTDVGLPRAGNREEN